MGCFPNQDCIKIERTLSFTHLAVGVFSFILALGFYLLLFNKTEKAIIERLENDKNENDIIFETYNSVSDISKKINTMNSFIHSDDYDTLNSYTKS